MVPDITSFFSPPADDPIPALIEVLRAVREGSAGRISSPETFNTRTGKPLANGLFCEKIFGPVNDYRCSCGKYAGREHEGVVCEKCGVQVGLSSVRRERIAHIELAEPLLHPATYPAAAALLGLTLDDFLRVMRREVELCEAGLRSSDFPRPELTGLPVIVSSLREREGGTDLLIDIVPISSPEERLPVRDETNPRMLHAVDGSVNAVYTRFLMRANRLRRLIELDAPYIILANEEVMLQEFFEELIEVVRAGNVPGGWERLGDEGAVPIVAPDEEMLEAEESYAEHCGETHSMIWLDEERLALARGGTLCIVGVGGELERELEIYPWPIRSLHQERFLVLSGGLWDIHGAGDVATDGICGVQVLDTTTWEFLDEVPAGVGLVSLQTEEPEDLYMVDWRHDRQAAVYLTSDRPAPGAYSREGDFTLATDDGQGGLILELATGLPLVNLGRLNTRERDVAFIQRDGSRLDASDLDAARDELFSLYERRRRDDDVAQEIEIAQTRYYEIYNRFSEELAIELDDLWLEGRSAVALTPDDRWRYLMETGRAGEDDTPVFRLTFDHSAAAFSPSADRLAIWLAEDDELKILDWPSGGPVEGLPGAAKPS
ncbi:MAG: hypothetical protein ACNA8W_20045 [Bradymonadaceae bacterium]